MAVMQSRRETKRSVTRDAEPQLRRLVVIRGQPTKVLVLLAAGCCVLAVGAVMVNVAGRDANESSAGLSGAAEETVGDFAATNDGAMRVGVPENALVLVDCESTVNETSSNTRLMADGKRLAVQALFASLQDKGYSLLARRLVVDVAGVGVIDFDPYRRLAAKAGPSSGYTLPGVKRVPLGIVERRQLEHVFAEPEVGPLVEVIYADPTILRRHWRDDPLDAGTTVLGQLIRVRGPESYRLLDDMSVEVTFGLHELAVAIDQGIKVSEFLGLLRRSEVDPATAWRDRKVARDNNLALVAAMSSRPSLLRVLLEHGVDPSLGRRSVLDELLSPSLKTVPGEHVLEVVRLLVQGGDNPYLPSTLGALRRWLPDARSLELHPDAAVELAAWDIEASAQKLAALVDEWDRRAAHASWIDKHCGSSWTTEAVLSGPAASLAGRVRQQSELDDAKMAKEQRNAEAMRLRQAQLGPDAAQMVDRIRAAWDDDRWEDAVLLADGLDKPEVFEDLLSSALYFGAPISVVDVLVERIGRLPEHAILILASGRAEDAIGIAEHLRQGHGLDIHFVDEQGRNAISEITDAFWTTGLNSVVVDERAARWLKYLAENSVTMRPSRIGFDPLDIVLAEIINRPFTTSAGIRVAQFLIDNGMPVGASHRELTEQIAELNFDAYRRLVRAIPTLATPLGKPQADE